MIHDVFVIDGVGHAMDFSDGNLVEGVPRETIQNFRSFAYGVFVGQLESQEPGYRLTLDEWTKTHFTWRRRRPSPHCLQDRCRRPCPRKLAFRLETPRSGSCVLRISSFAPPMAP